MQMQDEVKATQANQVDQFERLCKQIHALFYNKKTMQTNAMQRKYELTESSNLNTHIVRVN